MNEIEYNHLEFSISDNICMLKINRQKYLNALSKELIQELITFFNWIDTHEEIKAVILFGSGDKAFVAGADIKEMSELEICKAADAILAIDARGFLFGSSLAMKSSKPLVVARKPGKLPGEIITNKYSLEYGTNSLSIQKDSIKDYESFLIVDDLLATGGTVECVSKLLYSQDKKITGLSIVIELCELNGRGKFDFPVISRIIY